MFELTSKFLNMSKNSASANSNSNSASTNSNSNSASTSNSDSSKNADTGVGSKKLTLTSYNGVKHSLVIEEDGTVWDHNETQDSWATRENDKVLMFESTSSQDDDSAVDINSIKADKVTVKSGSTISKYNLTFGSTLTSYSLSKGNKSDIDNNKNQYNVAVIDDFDTPLVSENASDTSANDISHGELVRALISPNNPSAADSNASLNFNLGSNMYYSDILKYLDQIETRVKNGEDIDAVNMSMGSSVTLADYGLTDMNLADLSTNAGKQRVLNAMKADSGSSELVAIIQKVTKMASEGIEFYISSGNDFDDVYAERGDEYYNDYIDYDANYDGVVTGKELNIFNAMTLAMGDNVHVIGATSSTGQSSSALGGIANYSDQNGTVDAQYDGDVTLTYLGYDTQKGKYAYDVNGDGIADLYSATSDGADYYENGTSFAAPRAAKANDKYLT